MIIIAKNQSVDHTAVLPVTGKIHLIEHEAIAA
jgi:hypothetical protein